MSKAAAKRFLDAHLDELLETTQRVDGRITWYPGPRRLSRKGNLFYLGNSMLSFNTAHTVSQILPDGFVLDWHDESGNVIHSTTYRLER